jgi:flagellar protein FlaJ
MAREKEAVAPAGPAYEITREPPEVAFVSRRPYLWRLAHDLTERLKPMVPEAGVIVSPYYLCAKAVFWALVSALTVLPLLVLAVAVSPWFLLALAIPPLVLLSPYLRLRGAVGDRKRGLEQELPYFCIHATVLQSAGLDLYHALTSVIGKGIFRQVEKDARIAKKNARLYGQAGPLEVVETLGRTCPNPKFRSLLLGYSSEARSGGDIAGYLERRTAEFLRDARERWEDYTRDVSGIMEVVVVLLLVGPILLLGAGFLSPDTAAPLFSLFLCPGLPVVFAAGVGMLRGTQPKSYDQLVSDPLPAVLFSLFSFLALAASGAEWWLVACVSGAVGALVYGLPVEIQLRQIRQEGEGMVEFLRDVTEYIKMGHDLPSAISLLASERPYNPRFDLLLKEVKKYLEKGVPLSGISLPARSWFVRVGFFHLGEIADTGGYSAKSLELLTDFMESVHHQKRSASSRLNLYRILGLVAPIILGAVAGVILGVLSGIQYFSVAGAKELLPPVAPPLVGHAKALIIGASAGMGLLISYAADFTLKRTLWLAIALILSAVGIWIAGMGAEIFALS